MKHAKESGFTIVEVVTTLVVLSLFLAFFFQLITTAQKQRSAVEKRTLASDIAYSNLKKFPKKPAGLTCTVGDVMDQSAAGAESKAGRLIGSSVASENTPLPYSFTPEPTTITQKLGAYSKQTVRAYAPQGCLLPEAPYRIESVVEYGDSAANVERVVNATFVTQ